MNDKRFVSMTIINESDRGSDQGKINKLIVVCDTLDQAIQIEREAWRRPETGSINLHYGWPHFNLGYYDVAEVHYDDIVVDWALDRCDSGEGLKMNADTRKLYNEWLKDTIQADVPYQLDPAIGEVTEDLNTYTGLDLSHEEWGEYYRYYAYKIAYLEEYAEQRADARKRFEGRRYGDLTEEEKEEIMSKLSDVFKPRSGRDITILDFSNGLSIAVRESDGAEDDSKLMGEAKFYFADEL